MGVDNQSNGKITVSKVFVVVSVFVVLVCLAGMIICGYIFYVTTKSFSDGCSEVLLKIASSAASPNPTATLDEIETLTTHMETMIDIQKSGMTNDLMSFIYGILSTLLVGLCAGFVVKSQTNADEAKKTAIEAKGNIEKAEDQAKEVIERAKEAKAAITDVREAAREAEKSADNAERQAKEAARKANEAEEAVKQAVAATVEAKENAQKTDERAKEIVEKAKEIEEIAKQAQTATEDAKDNAKKTEENADRTAEIVTRLLYQVRIITVSSKIIYAKSLLPELKYKKIQANRAIKQIQEEITSLFSDEEFIKKKNSIDIMEIEKIYDQLIDLQQIIDSVSETLKEKYEGGELKSMEIATGNYKNWINDAMESMFRGKE